jgi:hypothetical protein
MPQSIQTIPVEVDLSSYDPTMGIDLREVCSRGLIPGTICGSACLQSIQRYANPNRGYRIRGVAARVILPTITIGRNKMTMQSWVEAWFEVVKKLGSGRYTETPIPAGFR